MLNGRDDVARSQRKQCDEFAELGFRAAVDDEFAALGFTSASFGARLERVAAEGEDVDVL